MRRHSLVSLVLGLILLVLSLIIQSQVNIIKAQTPLEFSNDEVVVKFKSAATAVDKEKFLNDFRNLIRQKIIQDAKTEINDQLGKIDAMVLKVPEGRVLEFVDRLGRLAVIQIAEPNYIARPLMATNDPYLSQQWNMYQIVAAKDAGISAWDKTIGNASIKVAVVDTGVDSSHPDLSGKVVSEVNFSSSSSTGDRIGHGTHVAGIIGAVTNNGIGVSGVGYDTTLMNVKVINDRGYGYYDSIANGIIWAVDNGAKVINLSLGGEYPQKILEDAVNYAWNKGAIVVAASGNSGNTTPIFPAYYTNSIAVAATNSSDQRAGFSNYGTWVDVAAPGDGIYSTYKDHQYQTMTGTSMSAPHVSGLAALLWAVNSCGNNCIRQKIELSADPISGTGSFWIHGRINALKAVEYGLSPTPTPTIQPSPLPTLGLSPSPSPTPTPSQTESNNVMTVSAIDMWSRRVFNWYDIYSKITVKSGSTPVSGAAVTTIMTTPTGANYTGTSRTNSQGQVTFMLRRARVLGTYSIQVIDVIKSGFNYEPTMTEKTLIIQ